MSVSGLNKIIRDIKKNEYIITPQLNMWLARSQGELQLPEELAERIAERIKQLLLEDPNSVGTREGRFGASSRGACERAQVFQFLGMPVVDRMDIDLMMIFLDGKWRHLRWQALLMVVGAIDDFEVKVSAPQFRLVTSLDGMLSNNYGVEIKGAGWIKDSVLEGQTPDAHALQIHSMLLASEENNMGLEKFVYIQEDKRTQVYKEIVVYPDKKVMARVRNELERLNHAVESKTLPPVLQECRNGKGTTYRKCPYSEICLKVHEWPEEIPLPSPKASRRKKLSHHK